MPVSTILIKQKFVFHVTVHNFTVLILGEQEKREFY